MNRKQKRRIAQRYLEKIEELNTKIRIKKECLAETKATLGMRARGYSERVQTSVSMDGVCDAVIELLELEDEIGESTLNYLKQKERIVTELFSMENRVYIDILSYRYLKGKSFEYIAGKVGYTYRHIQRKHEEALVAFYDEVLRKREKRQGN